MIFKDRFTAGKLLAKELKKYKNKKDAVVLAIPRGGLQVGYSIAKELNLNLDIILTKKISYPGNPEYAIGAVSLKEEIIDNKEVPKEYIKNEIKNIRKTLKERYKKYNTRQINVKNKIVILVDDGIATGKTMLLTIDLIKKQKPKKLIVVVPVGPAENFEQVSDEEAISLVKEIQSLHKN